MGNPNVIRIDHATTAGSFDVVVMQSPSLSDDLADTAKLLNGNPVYTVYLQVGDRKEWLLEYCLASSDNVHTSAYEVRIGDDIPITAPYPRSTAIPKDFPLKPIARQVLIHGFLTATGSLRNLEAPDKNPLAAQLLTLLAEWRFRPALRNSKPVELEVLFVIPARS
jgi:hypothetical protein